MKRPEPDSGLKTKKLTLKIVVRGGQMRVEQGDQNPPPQGGVQNAAPPPQVPAQNVVPPPQLPPQNVPPQGQAQNVVPPLQGQVQNAPPQAPAAALNRDEAFDIICFYMGQGDCSMIRCPDGKIVMIDCGSTFDLNSDFLKVVVEQVRHTAWAGAAMCIDALILTHSDADHHNKAKSVLLEPKFDILDPVTQNVVGTQQYDKLKIDNIYFSCAGSDTGPLAKYKGEAFNQEIYNHTFETSEIQSVTICSADDNNNFYKKWDAAGNFVQIVPNPTTGGNTWPIANRKHTILNGRTAGGKDWSVSLIAGNVAKIKGPIQYLGKDEGGAYFKDTAKADNAQSLITLFEIGGKKALFCGDATFSTENFLVQYQSALISNVDFLLAPHHGSEYASSIPFVNATNPKTVAVSVGFMEHSYRHPRKASVSRWVSKLQARVAEREIDYWDTILMNVEQVWSDWQKKYASFAEAAVYFWGEKYTFNTAPFIWLQATPKDQYYGVKRDKGKWQGALYREWVNKDIEETPFAVKPQNLDLPQFLRYQVG